MNRLHLLSLVAGLSLSFAAVAQEQSTTASGTSSVRPIPDSDVMYKKTVWRAIDLREKQNQPMFSNNREITKIIIDAVKRGELQAYKNDSLATPLTLQEFNEKLIDKRQEGGGISEEEKALGFGEEEKTGDDGWGSAGVKTDAPVTTGPIEYFPNQLYSLELKEDVIFDKKRSRMYHDIKAITISVPANLTAGNIVQEIGAFSYKDLARVFKNNPETAIWFNAQNDAQHKNLADAFDLWLFSSYITKVSNPKNSRLSEIYGSELQGILAAQRVAEEMIEYEYNLWSY